MHVSPCFKPYLMGPWLQRGSLMDEVILKQNHVLNYSAEAKLYTNFKLSIHFTVDSLTHG